MKKGKSNYLRTVGFALLLVALIFGCDFLKRSASEKSGNDSFGSSIEYKEIPVVTEITETEAVSVTENVPSGYIKADINTDVYNKLQKSRGDLCIGELALIDKTHSYNFSNDNSLDKIYGNTDTSNFRLSYLDIEAQKSMLSHFDSMMKDFYSLYGHNDVTITAAYSSYADQAKTYKAEEGDGPISKETAFQAGYSEHHTGYALDFKIVDTSTNAISEFDGTGDYGWITENCYKYGFVLRYPEGKEKVTGVEYQPSHFRYVGVPHSYIMHDNSFTLEEYLNDLKKHVYGYEHMDYTVFGYKYEIYYVPLEGENTTVPVPADRAYTLSGNNTDGFIVTICSSINPESSSAEEEITDTAVTGVVTEISVQPEIQETSAY